MIFILLSAWGPHVIIAWGPHVIIGHSWVKASFDGEVLYESPNYTTRRCVADFLLLSDTGV